jgi:hypothetical protein
MIFAGLGFLSILALIGLIWLLPILLILFSNRTRSGEKRVIEQKIR